MYKDISTKWNENIYKNNTHIMNVYFDNILIDPKYITDINFGNTLFDNELELGSVPSRYIEIQIHKKANIQIPKTIRIEYGILINYALTVAEVNKMTVGDLNKTKIKSLSGKDNINFEIIPIGIYNVDDYDDEDDNVINIKALDNIIKFETDNGYYDASQIINKKGYATLKEIAEDICIKKGLELRF